MLLGARIKLVQPFLEWGATNVLHDDVVDLFAILVGLLRILRLPRGRA